MMGRKSLTSIVLLFAFVLSALAVSNASAFQRAYTCTPLASVKDYNDQHCVTNVGAGNGSRGHTLISTANTEIAVTNAKTAAGTTAATEWKLRGTLAGFEVEIRCTGLLGEGILTNAAASVSGTGTARFTGCTVAAPPGCSVPGGKITTEELSGTTAGQAAKTVKFAPKAGIKLATVPIGGTGCAIPENNYPVTGSLIASESGATLTVTHAAITTQGTVVMGGVISGVEGAATFSMAGGGEPITLT